MKYPEQLVELQKLMKAHDPRALKVYETLGVQFGYTLAHWAEFYDYDALLIMGRVTSGEGGEVGGSSFSARTPVAWAVQVIWILTGHGSCSCDGTCQVMINQARAVLAEEFPELSIDVIQPSEQVMPPTLGAPLWAHQTMAGPSLQVACQLAYRSHRTSATDRQLRRVRCHSQTADRRRVRGREGTHCVAGRPASQGSKS